MTKFKVVFGERERAAFVSEYVLYVSNAEGLKYFEVTFSPRYRYDSLSSLISYQTVHLGTTLIQESTFH